jgi:hypothetical protein
MPKGKTRTRDFGSTKSIDDFDPLNFSLNGENFECRAAIQGSVLLGFVADADSPEGGKAAQALYGFFEKALEPDDYIRFDALLKDPKRIVDLNLLGEIAGWLVEEYTSRPTSEPKS